MSLIKFKRGPQSSLPLLEQGEPAVTVDTGGFFIGDGQKNLNFTPVNPNLVINGNFQVALTPIDRGEETLIAISGAHFRVFGNYLIKNISGEVYMSRPSTGSRLRIRCVNAKVEFDYFDLPCVYNSTGTNYAMINALQGSEVTLSYTVLNQTGAPFEILCGLGAQTRMIPTGESRVTATYTITDSVVAVLLYTTSSINGVVEVGNVKLELGGRATPFFPNAVLQDFAALSQRYRTYSLYLRAAVITADWISFSFPIDIANGVKNSVIPILNRIQITNMSGGVQEGFSSVISIIRENQPGTIMLTGSIRCTKPNHGLTEAGAFIDFSLDMRAP